MPRKELPNFFHLDTCLGVPYRRAAHACGINLLEILLVIVKIRRNLLFNFSFLIIKEIQSPKIRFYNFVKISKIFKKFYNFKNIYRVVFELIYGVLKGFRFKNVTLLSKCDKFCDKFMTKNIE